MRRPIAVSERVPFSSRLPPMAVRAPDVALVHLDLDRVLAVPLPGHHHHVPAFETDVVELEDERVGDAAVDAFGVVEDGVEPLEIPTDAPVLYAFRRPRGPSGPAAQIRASPVTVATDDFAFRDFSPHQIYPGRLCDES